MSSTQGSSSTADDSDAFLSARESSLEPDSLGLPQTDDALSAAISLLDLRSAGPGQVLAPAPAPVVPAELAVFIQEACAEHRYLRTRDVSTIVERPERLRAVKIGLAAAFARLHPDHRHEAADLEEAMDRLGLGKGEDGKEGDAGSRRILKGRRMEIIRSTARMSLDDPAFALVHPEINRPPPDWVPPASQPQPPITPSASPRKDPLSVPVPSTEPEAPPPTTYALQISRLCRESPAAFGAGRSEVPLHLPQGDLYLSPGSEGAIFGAVGACCEAVDSLFPAPSAEAESRRRKRAFVSVRPPGHHCAESEAMGFCWVNNVAVAAAHAHLKHGVDRVVILDMDLHHGNGTQDIVWKLNEKAERAVAAAAAASAASTPKKGRSPGKSKAPLPLPSAPPSSLRLFYGSLHDIFSYPCEDADPQFVRDASVNLLGGHGQWIVNVHLQPWSDEKDFEDRLYEGYKEGVVGGAERFLMETGARKDKTLVFISAGFDACEHEGAGMSRHSRNVPVSFYRRFTQDVVAFADRFAEGKVVSVLEGGYSDRALTSATLAHLSGLASPTSADPGPNEEEVRGWWELKNLLALEKACKPVKPGTKKAAAAAGLGLGREEAWLTATTAHFRILEPTPTGATVTAPPTMDNTPSTAMQLRVRRAKASQESTVEESPSVVKGKGRVVSRSAKSTPKAAPKEPAPPLPVPDAAPPPTMGAFQPRPSLLRHSSSESTPLARTDSEPLTDATTTTTDSAGADDEATGESRETSPTVQQAAREGERKLPKIKWTWRAGEFDPATAGPPRETSGP